MRIASLCGTEVVFCRKRQQSTHDMRGAECEVTSQERTQERNVLHRFSGGGRL